MATLSPPISPQQSRSEKPDARRAHSSMSFASTHSHRSSRSKEEKKLDLIESPGDKKKLHGKSDPTKALKEAQPATVAEFEESSLGTIEGYVHKDSEGNPIVDPDRSNPTRPRMERPLDTIRAFNAAAEGTTTRRSSYQRQSPQNGGYDAQSKRSSYYGSPNSVYNTNGRPTGPGPRPMHGMNGTNGYGQGGYYRNSSHGYQQNGYPEEGGPHPGPPGPHRRYQSAPYNNMPNGESPTSMHSNQHSYETMTSGSDEMSKSTNPSSQNSSFDQLHQAGMRKPENGYEQGPYRQMGGPMRNPYPPTAYPQNQNGIPNGYDQRPSGPTDDYGIEFQHSAPAPPPKMRIFTSNPNELNDAPVGSKLGKASSRDDTKRKSWIKRTLSRRKD